MTGIFGVMACDPKGVIGLSGNMPWHYPDELAHYRKITAGKPLIMGYLTYLAMPESALANRTNIVFSHSRQNERKGCPATFVSSWDEFLKVKPVSGCMIGGGQIARLFLENDFLDFFILTRIHKNYPGDTFFPLKLIEHWPFQILLKTPHYTIYRYENPTYSHSSHPSS